MPKVLKKFEHEERASGNFQSKYDWKLILGGKDVCLVAGEDYEAEGTHKDGSKFDRTDAFVTAIRAKAYDENKNVRVTKVKAGSELAKKLDLDGTGGLVVTATPMTPEQVADRKADLERKRQERAAAKAAEGTNGTAAAEAPEAAEAIPLE